MQARGSKLILLRGSPQEQLPLFWREHQVTDLVFESDTGGAATVPPIIPDHTLASISSGALPCSLLPCTPTPVRSNLSTFYSSSNFWSISPQHRCYSCAWKHNVACDASAEPYARQRDSEIVALAKADKVSVTTAVGHTLYVRPFPHIYWNEYISVHLKCWKSGALGS